MHDEAARAEDTDWPQILALYELLKRMSDNPMVMLNHAIAAAMVHGPSKGLELLKTLDADAPCRAIIVSTRFVPICSKWLAITRRQSGITGLRLAGRQVSRSGITFDASGPARRGRIVWLPEARNH